jgi:signal transduction histidine kinase
VRSLRSRLTLWLTAGAGLLLVAAGLALHMTIGSRLEREFDKALMAKATSLMALTEQENGEVWLEVASPEMPEFDGSERPEYYQLWLGDDSVIERSRSLGNWDLPLSDVRLGGLPLLRNFTLPDGRPGRLIEITFYPRHEQYEELERQKGPVPVLPTPPGSRQATVVVARGRGDLDAFLASLRMTLLLFVAGLIAAMAVLVKLSLDAGLAPLDRLGSRLKAMHADSLDAPLESEDAPAELVPLIARLEELLARLRESFRREREFSANLAHELRTPLAELRALADVALKWPEDAGRPDLFEDVRGIGLQMERIVLNLLTLARYDGRQDSVSVSEVPLHELAESCWSPFAREAGRKAVSLHLEIPDGLTVVTDREKLSLILTNLFSNAVAYGSPGGPVTCSAVAAQGQFALRIANPTGSLLPEDLPRIFDRFWRKDPARTGGQHAGLGLTLVSALSGLLGLKVEARLASGTFEITLLGPLDGALPQLPARVEREPAEALFPV